MKRRYLQNSLRQDSHVSQISSNDSVLQSQFDVNWGHRLLCEILQTPHEIYEVDLLQDEVILQLPCDSQADGAFPERRSPVVHERGHVGICRSAIGTLVKLTLTQLREVEQRGNNADHRTCESYDTEKKLNTLTFLLLLLDADFTEAWNYREHQLRCRLSVRPSGTVCEDELQIVRIILELHPKSGEAWAYRQFLLQRCQAQHPTTDVLNQIYRKEVDLVNRQATVKREFHYHALTHWHWLFHKWWMPNVPKGQKRSHWLEALQFLRTLSAACPAHFGVFEQQLGVLRELLTDDIIHYRRKEPDENRPSSLRTVVVQFLKKHMEHADITLELFSDNEASWEYRLTLAKYCWDIWKRLSLTDAVEMLSAMWSHANREIDVCRRFRRESCDQPMRNKANYSAGGTCPSFFSELRPCRRAAIAFSCRHELRLLEELTVALLDQLNGLCGLLSRGFCDFSKFSELSEVFEKCNNQFLTAQGDPIVQCYTGKIQASAALTVQIENMLSIVKAKLRQTYLYRSSSTEKNAAEGTPLL